MSTHQPHPHKGATESLAVEQPPQACKTPDPLSVLCHPHIKRRSSSNYLTSLIANGFPSRHIAKVSPPISPTKEQGTEFPFKKDYNMTNDPLEVSPSLTPPETDLSRWSSEGSKRRLQRGSIDLTHEKDFDNDLCIQYGKDGLSHNHHEYKSEVPHPHQHRPSSIYHSNQSDCSSPENTNPYDAPRRSSTFDYDDFKRRMQNDS